MTSNQADPPTVLIVDEVPAIIQLLTLELRIQGFKAEGCGIGEDTFRAVEEYKPSAILLEIILPGVSGLEMLRQLKQRYDIPVIILTTLDSEADRAEAFDIGADDYIQKPFDPLELGRRVGALIEGAPQEKRFFRSGDLLVDLARQVARRGTRVLSLTMNEWATLLAIASSPDGSLSFEQLEAVVAAEQPTVRRSILDHLILRLRQSLEEDHEKPRIILGDLDVGIRLGVPISSAED